MIALKNLWPKTYAPKVQHWISNISINTDDPGMFHNSMAEEYALLIHKFDFKRSEIKKLILNAVQSSWRPDKIGPSLIEKFTNNNNWA